MRGLALRSQFWTPAVLIPLLAATGIATVSSGIPGHVAEAAAVGSKRSAGSCWGTFGGVNAPGACWRPYGDSSPFNRKLPHSPRLATRSSEIVARTIGFGPMTGRLGGVADTGDDWDHPIYFSHRANPRFTVHCAYSPGWGRCEVEGARVRIPDAALAAAGDDGHLAVINLASGWEYDFWQVREKPRGGGTLVVSYGGRTRIKGRHSTGLHSNATAASFGLAAGVIRPSELAARSVDHALFMSVRCTNGHSVWPAGRTGSGRACSSIGLSNYGAPAMGQHFLLRMGSRRIDALPVPAWKKAILHAMARYGLFVGDTGNPAWGFQFESGASFTSFGLPDPWLRLGAKLKVPTWTESGRRYYQFDLSGALDWRANLAVAKPCVARRSCR